MATASQKIMLEKNKHSMNCHQVPLRAKKKALQENKIRQLPWNHIQKQLFLFSSQTKATWINAKHIYSCDCCLKLDFILSSAFLNRQLQDNCGNTGVKTPKWKYDKYNSILYVGLYIRDGSRFSFSRFNDRISIRLFDYFLKVYPHWLFWTLPELPVRLTNVFAPYFGARAQAQFV